MSRVRLKEITKRYGATMAVDRVSADIAEGEFVSLLGPSGCGKTTTLRMIAGLVEPTSGEIWFDDQLMNDVPTHRRNIGLVFQSHALFPHLSVAKNIAFGLEMKGVAKKTVNRRVEEMLELVELGGYGGRMPSQLSGGQQQRVALARMLATDPRVLLFDEPLSALDRNLRDSLKYAILDLQRRTKKTAIYVTHDQSEAFAISDRVFVMNKGRVEQVGPPQEIYRRPASEFVATFVGDNNALPARVLAVDDARRPVMATVDARGIAFTAAAPAGIKPGEAVTAFIRPEHVEVAGPGATGPDVVEGEIEQIVFEGPTVRLTVGTPGGPLRVTVGGVDRMTLLDGSGRTVRLRLREASLVRAEA